MRRPTRQFEVFSLSAVDLFCSAMGAFIVIAIALMPYFRKVGTAEEVEKMRQTISQQQQKIEQQQRQIEKMQLSLQDVVQLAILGIMTKKESFVLVLDLSGSMEDYQDAMISTCKTVLDSMQDHHRCQIVGFHSPDGSNAFPQWPGSGLSVMNPASRAQAMRFVEGLMGRLEGGTPTGEAMEIALSSPAECVFLLSDGTPTDAANSPGSQGYSGFLDGLVDSLTRRNAGRKEVHCVAIGDYNTQPELVEFLSALATKNGGQFIGVSK